MGSAQKKKGRPALRARLRALPIKFFFEE